MNDNTADIGKLILRAYIGLAMLGHGIPKIIGGIGGVEGMLANQGLPGLLAYGVYVGEVVAPMMLILGLYARIGGVLIVVNMLFAIALAHTHEIFALTERGAWALELQGFYLFGGLAVALIGGGRYALRPEA
ncbi:DoxX family protein [Spectribacter hydrogenoxidans]|uniref:DoxX family protein n=1 Tax=Spectribacter hydrogenoxidans TaxID=3075608 RepID=A0ABU3BY70_9GAMM|nr:DoxX family protein [Salinisphaera sp. W335]MDT0634243.1 DoxX family protein [Salinisphaera sp. W335]